MPASRIACLVVPDLPLQALVRAEPSLREVALAVTLEPPPRPGVRQSSRREAPLPGAVVVAVSAAAQARAVRPGLTAAQARALCPGLTVRTAHAEQVAAARAALLDAALGFAPRVEAAAEAVFLEVGDLGRLHDSERALALSLRARARAVGLDVGVGLAASKGVARLAAWRACVDVSAAQDQATGDGVCLVGAGGEAGFAGGLPLPLLARGSGLDARAAAELCEALARWGVSTGARLAQLPAPEVALRLGQPGARLRRLAAGLCDEPLASAAPPDACEEGSDLDFAIYEVEPLAFVLRGLLDRLLARLSARHLACAGLTLRLRLESGGHDVREVPVAAPTRDLSSLLQLIRLDVERRPPEAAVVGMALVGRAACARPDQLDLFRPAGPSPERLATTLAKLEALLGPGAVGSPQPADNHREESLMAMPYAVRPAGAAVVAADGGAGGGGGAGGNRPDPALGLRRYRPERAVEVLLDAGAVPRAVRGAGISCVVVVAAGPFRVQGEWWQAGGFARDYWDVHASDGALYRLYRDRVGDWYVAGYYD